MHASPVLFRPIGVIHSDHVSANQTPIQPVYAGDCTGRAEIFAEFADGLADIEGFSHIYLVTWLHQAGPPRLRVTPFLQDAEHGIFATRAPCRPNPIGLSLVRLIRREGPVLHLAGVDMLDGTPLLDLKPYSPRYDSVDAPRGGWTDEVDDATARRRGRRDHPGSALAGPHDSDPKPIRHP